MSKDKSSLSSSCEHIQVMHQDCMDADGSIKEGAALLLTIKRPEKRNALTRAMYEALAHAINHANDTDGIRSIIIAGEKGIFTSGNDLNDFADPAEVASEDSPVYQFMLALMKSGKPVIAAVDGVAIGIGATMLMHCDFVYCSPGSSFRMPFVNLGLVPEFASSYMVGQMAGHRRASEWLLLGESFWAQDAVDSGLVSHVDPNPIETAFKTASKIAFLPPKAMRISKALIKHADHDRIRDTMDLEIKAFVNALEGDEFKEAALAFFEKRSPDF